jgi:hypothetical protein
MDAAGAGDIGNDREVRGAKMSYRKHAARLLGLLAVAVLGVMALASSAQAHKFLVNKGFLLATFGGTGEGTGTILISGLSFQISCTTLVVTKGVIETSTHGEVELLYTGCTTLKIKTAEEFPCHVKEPIHATALLLPTLTKDGKPAILAEKIKALILLHSNKITAEWPLGTLPCILPLDNTVTGELCFKIVAGNDTTEPLVLTNDTTQGECDERTTLEGTEGVGAKDVLKYGAQVVTTDSATKMFLTGPHQGLPLGVSS